MASRRPAPRLSLTDVLNELYADSDSEGHFSEEESNNTLSNENSANNSENEDSGEEEETVTRNVPSGYEHEWLRQFDRTQVGPQHIPEDASESDIIRLLLNDDFFELCVTETNRYANNYIATHELSQHSRAKKWKDVATEEMVAVRALLLLTGVNRRSSYDLYWSTDPLIDMKGFRDIMPRGRFLSIMNFLHLVDNDRILFWWTSKRVKEGCSTPALMKLN